MESLATPELESPVLSTQYEGKNKWNQVLKLKTKGKFPLDFQHFILLVVDCVLRFAGHPDIHVVICAKYGALLI